MLDVADISIAIIVTPDLQIVPFFIRSFTPNENQEYIY